MFMRSDFLPRNIFDFIFHMLTYYDKKDDKLNTELFRSYIFNRDDNSDILYNKIFTETKFI